MVMRKIQVVMMTALLSGVSLQSFAQEPDKKKETGKERIERQQNLNREMTLEREYNPIVQDAAKVNTLPVVREMNISKRPIVYSDYAVPTSPNKEMNILPAGTLMTDVAHSKRNGYLHFAGGTRMNFNGDFGYHLLNTDRDKLGVYFSHRSTNGDVKFSVDSIAERKAKLNDNFGGLDFSHRFDAATLSLGGSFGYSAFNYYGIPTNTFAAPVAENDSATNQGNRYINAYAGVTSNRESSLGYHMGIDYKNFNQKYSLSEVYDGLTENNIGLNLGLSSPVNNDQRFGVDLKMNMLTYTEPGISDVKIDSAAFDNRYEITLSPYYRLENDRIKLLLGLNLMIVSQDETDVFVSPNVALDVPIANWSLFYINLGGGIESNTIYELSRINRYINPAFTPDASKTWADLKLGVRSNVATGLWFDIFAGYKYTESDIFYNPSSYDWIDKGFNNVSMAFQPTSQRLQAGATLKYDYRHIVGFYLKGVYNHYNLKYLDTWKNVYSVTEPDKDDDLKAYGRPTFTFDAGLNIRPVKPLTLSADYSMASGAYACLNNENVKINTINDLRFRASWQFNDMLSVYAQFNNLLFRKHEMYYGYPLQPFSAMAGFSVTF
ncbi:MAG TPA: TonB-dependent receptor [Porphyromonadaceae bacterium]|nr:TonB-dependent receptor [Porphyromonadaceae bacterium]